jgi:ubiquitin-activating enzyme E1
MRELNSIPHIKIKNCKPYEFTLELDSTDFGEYLRQGIVENVKVPLNISFHSLSQSVQNPAASSKYGLMEPDLRTIGRSE